MNNVDRIVIITGAGKGAGRALAEALAASGATVAANDISPINVEEVVAGIRARGGKAKAYVEDVAKKVAVQALLKTVEDELGGIDVLIVHAAVEPRTSLLDMDEWDWHRVLDVNLTGAFLMIQSAGRMMRERGRGVIITILPAADIGVRNDAGAYTASMAGLRALSAAADRELGPYGVRVWAVENRGHQEVVETVRSLLQSAA